MDESWDLGFGKDNSKYFIITFLCTQDKKGIWKLIWQVLSEAKRRKANIIGGVVHSAQEKPITMIRLLQLLVKHSENKAMSIILKKSNIPPRLRRDSHQMYNLVVGKLLEYGLERKLIDTNEKLVFIASRRETKKSLNSAFIQHLQEITEKYGISAEICIKTPHEERGLQIVDMVAWTMYQKYNKQDSVYYEIISPLVIAEYKLNYAIFA